LPRHSGNGLLNPHFSESAGSEIKEKIMKSLNDKTFISLALMSLGFLLSGCPKAKGPAVEPPPVEDEATAPETPVDATGAALDIGTDFAAVPGVLESVSFSYMSAELSDMARASLKKNAAVLKSVLKDQPSVKVRVEGHCDERGTLEYNLALGERRATAVRGYYATLGLSKAALSTISYGEERPVCTEADDDCWAQNRRGETTLKAATAVRVPLAQ
jgi:peptidoglycan-associated lipoprotein